MDKIKYNVKYTARYWISGLDTILVVNIILKYFNLINWNWKMALWPLWTDIILSFGIFCWDRIKDRNEK